MEETSEAPEPRRLYAPLHTLLHIMDDENVAEQYLEAFLQEYGWNAEWIRFPRNDRVIAWVGSTFAGETVVRKIARWRVMDLLREPTQLRLGAGDPLWG